MTGDHPDSIEDDRRCREVERIEAMLLEGLSSGERTEVGPEFWEERHRRLARRLSPHRPNSAAPRPDPDHHL